MKKSFGLPEHRQFLDLLLESRQNAGLTQQQLAKKIDETQSFVSKIERGEIRMDLVQLNTYCQAMGTTLSKFVREFEARVAAEG